MKLTSKQQCVSKFLRKTIIELVTLSKINIEIPKVLGGSYKGKSGKLLAITTYTDDCNIYDNLINVHRELNYEMYSSSTLVQSSQSGGMQINKSFVAYKDTIYGSLKLEISNKRLIDVKYSSFTGKNTTIYTNTIRIFLSYENEPDKKA